MQYLLIFLLMPFVCLIAHTPLQDQEHALQISKLIRSNGFDEAVKLFDEVLEKLDNRIRQSTDKRITIHLLQERAFVYLFLKCPQDALIDLDTIISLEISNPDEKKDEAVLKALQMHLAISAVEKDEASILRDIDLLKKWVDGFTVNYIPGKISVDPIDPFISIIYTMGFFDLNGWHYVSKDPLVCKENPENISNYTLVREFRLETDD